MCVTASVRNKIPRIISSRHNIIIIAVERTVGTKLIYNVQYNISTLYPIYSNNINKIPLLTCERLSHDN